MIIRCRPYVTALVRCRNIQRHGFDLLLARYSTSSSDRKKVQETLKMLRDVLEKQKAEEDEKEKQLALIAEPKPPIRTRIMNELKHYYHGFRLLALETRLSARYLWRMARGSVLTRRERQQLIRTVSDLFRLVPFLFFVIVPFMEFVLPFFIKFFPGMLPSTFQEASKEKERIRHQAKVRQEMAKFLSETLEEVVTKESKKDSEAYKFTQFLRQVRSEGSYVSNKDLFNYTKLFQDEITLENLSMSQLRALCRILAVPPLGTPEILRFQLTMKLRDLQADDRLIAAEGGVDALSVQEVQSACRARGMRALGMDEERLRNQLKEWLELSLDDKVPPSLLLLSRALFIPDELTFADRLRTILSTLPEELGDQTRQKLAELEDEQADPKARLALIKSIEEGLKQEREEEKQKKKEEAAAANAEAAKESEKQKQRTAASQGEAEEDVHSQSSLPVDADEHLHRDEDLQGSAEQSVHVSEPRLPPLPPPLAKEANERRQRQKTAEK